MSDSVSVLVTGSAGRLGSAACTELLAHGHQVRGFDVRDSPGLADAVVGDLANPEDVSKAMADIEVVVHLAATPDEDDFISKLLPNNIIGLYNVLESARQTNVHRVILAIPGR